MPSIFNSWYNNQYSSWNRTRRLQAPPFVARVDTRTSRNATAMHNGTDVNANGNGNAGDTLINMGDLAQNSPLSSKDNKDTLFGPSIGVVSAAPEWCAVDAELDEKYFKGEKEHEFNEKEDDDGVDELTPEIVKEWVRRSKEPSEPTTTLQALVNLKRPSIRLSPLAAPASDPSSSSPEVSSDGQGKHHQQHGLEFEFDCDAPQCLISLHVIGVPASLGEDEHHEHSRVNLNDTRNAKGVDKESERLLLFETTVPGGFARKLTLSDGAVLELAQLEAAARSHRAQLAAAAAASSTDVNQSNGVEGSANSPAANAGTAEAHDHHRKRLAFFRKKIQSRSHSSSPSPIPAPAPVIPTGPALAVVDAEAPPLHPNPAVSLQSQNTLATFFAGGDAEKARRKKEADEEGVRIAIRLVARDAEGRPMKVRNEQVTYLHIVRQVLPASTAAGNSTSDDTTGPEDADANGDQAGNEQVGKDEDKEKEDTRPWVVRVVKREARIGAHAFQLHEIYGLTAHASASEAAAVNTVTPSSPPPTEHTYPPTPGQPQMVNGTASETEDSPAECLLCLSAAREVVLLPCRHLVACRECAVNMVEFGAGGTVVHPEAEVPSTTGNNTGENAGGTAGAQGETAAPPPAPVAPIAATRRKRKAKGWFCPVCRQPYTSLLRITTAPPPSSGSDISNSPGDSGDAKRVSLTSSLDGEADSPQHSSTTNPLTAVAESGTATPAVEESGGNGPFAGLANGLARPGFLRHFSGRAGRERDLERGT